MRPELRVGVEVDNEVSGVFTPEKVKRRKCSSELSETDDPKRREP